jgi:NhaP-type Na+/H+ or K+/H+ antiporter
MESAPDLTRTIRRLNARILGISLGLLLGVGLFVATNWLVIKGGENVGQHLSLLGNFFPGYSVTLVGSFIGFVYAFVLGYAIGVVVAAVYAWSVKS